MIHSGTVLILGAGASVPFGFPCGRRLLLEIAGGISVLSSSLGGLGHQLEECGYDRDLVKRFAKELLLSMQPSVDAFLEKRREYVEVGKAAIACSLIPYEREPKLYRYQGEGPHWYEYLFSQMGTTLEDFKNSQLSVITFNYDRSLEHSLFLALKNSYGLSDEECEKELKAVRIVHMYGTLGGSLHSEEGSRPYNDEVTPDVVKQCTSAIRILHEGTIDDPELDKARELLMHARVICFLGFGYHYINIRRLRLELLPGDRELFGTAYGITAQEQERIKERIKPYLPTITMGGEETDVLRFLRDFPIFA
jgi:hypothetical protein